MKPEENEGTDIIDLDTKKAILIWYDGDNIVISGTTKGEMVHFYSILGSELYSKEAEDGVTTIKFPFTVREAIIVKYGKAAAKFKL